MFTFGAKTYADKRISAMQRRNMTQGTFVAKDSRYFLIMCLVAITITQFACAEQVPVSRCEYMDLA